MYSNEEEGEYRHAQQQRWQNYGGPSTPLSEDLEELQWPRRFNSAMIPQYDGESDPKQFVLKYGAVIDGAVIEATGGGGGFV